MDPSTLVLLTGMGLVGIACTYVVAALAHVLWLQYQDDAELGAEVGLQQRRYYQRLQLNGEPGGVEVDVHPLEEADGRWTAIQARGVPRQLFLAPAGRCTAPLLVPTGDPGFDRVVHVAGPPAVVRAWLSERTREILLPPMRRSGDAWRTRRLQVVDGRVRLRIRGAVHQAEELKVLVDEVLGIAEVLRRDGPDLEERLLATVRRDPVPEVRVRCLECLLERTPSPRARQVVGHVLDADDARLQLVAARHLGHASTLVGLAEASWIEDDLRVAALHALGDCGDRGAAVRAARLALRTDADTLRIAGVQLAGRWIAPEALPELLALVEHVVGSWDRDDRRPLARALAHTLGRLEGRAVEQALLQLLGAPFLDVVAQACTGLAQVGSTSAIDPLIERTDHPDPTVREAVRSALAAVRYREGATEGGALSLFEGPSAGALSLAEGDGALALIDDER